MNTPEIASRVQEWKQRLAAFSVPDTVEIRVLGLDNSDVTAASTVAIIAESECNCGVCDTPVRFDYELVQETPDGRVESVKLSRLMHQRIRIDGLLLHGWTDGFDDPAQVAHLIGRRVS